MREGKLWARIGDACQPVAIDDAATGKLEVTTCVDGELTCGVTITTMGAATLDRAWCRRGRDLLTGLVDDETLCLVHATDGHAAYLRLVNLVVVPVGERRELQSCTPKSLRALKRQDDALVRPADRTHGPIWLGPVNEQGQRHCTFVEGFRVAEVALPAPPKGGRESDVQSKTVGGVVRGNPEGAAPAPEPPSVDCSEPCSTPSIDEMYKAHRAAVAGRAFLPPEPQGLDLFRTPAACAAATGTPPSALPVDLCATLGARLR